MKLKLIFHIASFLIISNILFAQNNCKVTVNISSNIDSSLIFIDDELVGKGKTQLDLEIGHHELLLMKSNNEWGTQVIKDSIHIISCDQSLELDYEFKETTVVVSSPNAAVTKQDSILGYTPLTIPLSYEKINLQKTGYTSSELLIGNVPVQKKVTLNFSGMKEDEPFIDSSLFKILIGSAVALGATAAYFKLKADDKFDQYLETRRSDYLDDTDRFDLYSGLAFGALQLNFGALLYYFLIE